MIELTQIKKNKVTLSDYNHRRDIENRLLLSKFTTFERSVLEEILFSPIHTQIRKMAKNLDCSEEELVPVLEKLSKTGLLTMDADSVMLDKEMRRYFETEVAKFESDFVPDMEFLQNLLKKVPIHVLPIWYSIPRTSNNIFDSLVEKYLLTPQVFQRYLLELSFGDPVISAIAQDVFKAPQYSVPVKDLLKKYQLSEEKFEEHMLTLEFHFVCCLAYQKQEDDWTPVVTPFHEWREYLTFLKTTNTPPLADTKKVKRKRPHDFSFVEEMTLVLQAIKKQSVALNPKGLATLATRLPEPPEADYLDQILRKLQLLKLATVQNDKISATEAAAEWLEMRVENRALYLYRHPLNKILSAQLPSHLNQESVIRDAEKSILRALYSGWVLFDDFLQGVIEPIGEHPAVTLKKSGKSWKYLLPAYTPEEKALIRAVIFEWLFEAGITATGTIDGKECFMVTPFGQSLFG